MVEPSRVGKLSTVPASITTPAQATHSTGLSTKHGLPRTRLLVFAVIAASGLAWDLWTKHQVFTTLGFPGVRPLWKGQFLGVAIQFQLETTFNHGALWGMGQGQTWLFASLSFVAAGVIGYFLWQGHVTASKWLTVATGLLLAGTLGNLFDRLGLHGCKDPQGQLIYAVRDFLDFWFFGTFHWATFNFADTYLVTGAIMLVVHSFLMPPPEPNTAARSMPS
ncbi:MAG: signal peptidase II [Planctomycetota bacterium]